MGCCYGTLRDDHEELLELGKPKQKPKLQIPGRLHHPYHMGRLYYIWW
jgi:hypothetical protein